jgi:hypothetical protein
MSTPCSVSAWKRCAAPFSLGCAAPQTNPPPKDGIIRPLFPTPDALKPLPKEMTDKGGMPTLAELLNESMEEATEYYCPPLEF